MDYVIFLLLDFPPSRCQCNLEWDIQFNFSSFFLSSTRACSLKDFSEGDDDFYSQRHSILTEFFQSLWFALISNTDLICYALVFMNMVASQSLLALPMPLMVFLWGTLTVPRPSKTFWISLIAYTEVIFSQLSNPFVYKFVITFWIGCRFDQMHCTIAAVVG